MPLLTKAERARLLKNGRRQQRLKGADTELDPHPVVKLFTPDAGATWLLTELDPDDEDLAFGLCDLGLGCPELGSVRISELERVRGRFGLPVERDQHFQADKPLSAYAEDARKVTAIRA